MHVVPQMTQLHQDVDHVKAKVKQQDQDLKVSSPLVSMWENMYTYILI